jgi:ketosteroid isomerase-like protein
MIRTLALLAVFMAVAGPAAAHPPAILNSQAEQAIGEEITAFRKTVAEAIRTKDADKLRRLYAPSFVHTHTTGKLDNRDARIVAALAGDPVIEIATVEDLVIRVPNDWTAIATGQSPIKSPADGKTYAVRWIAVYTRTETSWQLAASQATRVGEVKP